MTVLFPSSIPLICSFGIERKKFFYDEFLESDVCGIFNLPHLITVILFFGLAALLLFASRKASEKAVRKIHIVIAIAVTVMEIIKITLRIYKGQGYDDWVPLYYCSLFLFAVWLSLAKNEHVKTVGQSYVVMGGIVAASFFSLYPSTSLAIFPIWHPSVFHSFIYHLSMLYLGCLFVMKKIYIPKPKHSAYYFVFIFIASVVAVVLNETLGTNCMFLRHAFGLPFLGNLDSECKWLYILIVFSAQAVALFWANYLVYFLAQKFRNTKSNRKIKEK